MARLLRLRAPSSSNAAVSAATSAASARPRQRLRASAAATAAGAAAGRGAATGSGDASLRAAPAARSGPGARRGARATSAAGVTCDVSGRAPRSQRMQPLPPRARVFEVDVRPADEDESEAAPPASGAAAEPSLRRVHVAVCETDFERGGLGWRVWGAALVLARELARAPRSLLHRRRVLELGAGCGLCGLLAAQLGAAEVTLSDALPALIDTLAAGAALQSSGDSADGDAPLPPWTWRGAAPGSRIRVRSLLWDDDVAACGDATAARSATEAAFARSMLAAQLRKAGGSTGAAPSLGADERFEVVIGSDLLYDWSAVRPLTATIVRRLAPGGLCLLSLPVRDKPLLDALAEGLTRAGLAWDARPSAPPTEAPRADDAGGDEPLACVDLRVWHPDAPPAPRWRGWPSNTCDHGVQHAQ